jgi:hypothetical protein
MMLMDGIPETLIAAVPVIGVLVAWLMSLREQVREWRDEYQRLESEYRQALKDAAGLRAQAIVNEAHMSGRLFQAESGNHDTQPFLSGADRDQLRRSSQGGD